MISAAEVAKLAHRLGVGDRMIEKDYVLSWLLVAIAESKQRSGLVFKGGTALKRCYYPEYRFSEDLDFTLCLATPEAGHYAGRTVAVCTNRAAAASALQ